MNKLAINGGWLQTQPPSPMRHYFNNDNLSICKYWISSVQGRSQDEDANPDNCERCAKELEKLKAVK